MEVAIWAVVGLMLGCLPFSYWVGRVFVRKDIRRYGDGNPGATNVFNAGGPVLYVLAILLDAFKAALPVWLSQQVSHVTGLAMIPVALAPLAGNIFTPFLRFNGGTGVAVVYGTWLALTGWQGPVIIAASFGLLFIFIRETPWCVIIGMTMITIFLLIAQYPLYMACVSAGQTALMGYRRRQNFTHWPKMQKWVGALSGRNKPDIPLQS
ncbi:MAG: glycerol-3-phosphate acyltransferase [Dehalococcoidia bacterium]|nr:glycerol-3-phosphate acyltransferase [Dehalococcoidia bacterium]